MSRRDRRGWCPGWQRPPHFSDRLRNWNDRLDLCPACLESARREPA